MPDQDHLDDLEKQFDIKVKDVKNAVKGVIKFASNNPRLQNQLFNEEIPLFLQINSFKVPKTKGPVKQVFRVPLEHSPLPSDADICLIVPDVKGIKNNEHEKHLEYYDNLLRSKDVTGIKKIMTFHEFRTEYDTFELKNRLADLYDVFLVDGKISGKVVHKCGSIFYKKRKLPIAIKTYLPKLKPHIEQALKKAFIQLNVKADSQSIQIGYSKLGVNALVDNVYSVVKFLDTQFPGRMNNIRSLNVYAHRGSSIPIYVSLKNPNEIRVPTLSNSKPKAYKSFSGELTTQYNADVVVKPSGQVIVRRKKNQDQNENPDDNITDAEILNENKVVDQMDEEQNGDSKKTKKGSKKRKLSESESNINNTKEMALKKDKKPKQITLKQKKSKQSAELNEELGHEKVLIKKILPKAVQNKDEKKKVKDVKKIKSFEKKVVKNKIKRKTSLAK